MGHSLASCNGQVFAFLFRDGVGARIPDGEFAPALARPHDWVWLHLGLSDHRARRFLENWPDLGDEARALLLGNEDRIQLLLPPGAAFGVLPDIAQDFSGHDQDAGRLLFWLNESVLVTVRRAPLSAVDDVRGAVIAGERLATPAAALARLQERFAAIVETRLALLARELGRFEDAVLGDREGPDQLPLGPLRRELSRHTREFMSLRSALHRALSGRALSAQRGAADNPLLAHLAPMLQDAEDVDRDAAALQDRARLLKEDVDTRIAAITNRSLSALTVISTLLLPPTFVVGAFGMNVEGLPWAHDTDGFAIVIGFCLVLVGVGYAVLRRFRILP